MVTATTKNRKILDIVDVISKQMPCFCSISKVGLDRKNIGNFLVQLTNTTMFILHVKLNASADKIELIV